MQSLMKVHLETFQGCSSYHKRNTYHQLVLMSQGRISHEEINLARCPNFINNCYNFPVNVNNAEFMFSIW